MNSRISLAISFILVAFPISAMAGGDPGNLAEVGILKFKFEPQVITIKAGDTVRWTNNEKRQYHSVWFEALGEPEAPYFFPGENYERTFNNPGEFPYRCGPHPKMTGTVIVE
ncbi:MAG: plastocyanin/azurin family copper-binding protein [Candidatus Sedimenticola sp. PURPLELP]